MKDEIVSVDLKKLLLDEQNPRLPESIERDQQSMIDYIAESTSIEELMQAIGENDYFPGEPLIAVPHETKKGHFVIVEGNRRLTALKLLTDPKNCSNPGAKMREISSEAKYKPKVVPVVVRDSRADVLPYLGFRHITGVKQWEPLAKARYIEQLFNLTNKKKAPKDRYSDVSRAIGSRRDHIKRNLDALAVYKEIKDKDFYDISGLNDESIKFSILSTALADDRIGSFVGLSTKSPDGDYISNDVIINPKPLQHKEISELTRWLFEKDSKGKTKVGESRNLRYLAAVVESPKAISAFRSNSPLKIAYQLTADSTLDFIELLYLAEGSLTEASSMVATVNYTEDGFDTAKRILENIKLIGRELKSKNRQEEDEF
jgi:hypothetical protein